VDRRLFLAVDDPWLSGLSQHGQIEKGEAAQEQQTTFHEFSPN
jgi:hypothetical protein